MTTESCHLDNLNADVSFGRLERAEKGRALGEETTAARLVIQIRERTLLIGGSILENWVEYVITLHEKAMWY